MSDAGHALILPARITADRLAAALDRELSEVLRILETLGFDAAPEEVLGADLAVSVAAALGIDAAVEPRDLALECLYEFETRGELESAAGGRAGAIVESVIANIDTLDGMIESVSERWSVARMPVIDRNIIRMGLHELLDSRTPPTAVVINEAVRLARTYSTEKSPSFVNGVLATLAKTIRES